MADTKWSQIPSATPDNADEVVGLHSGNNARFSVANFVLAVRQGLANLFVPSANVGVAGGVAGLDADGKVPGNQLDLSGKQDTITASGILKGDGAGGVSAAVAGTDYQAPLTAGTDYATPSQLEDKANQSQLAYIETGTTASRNYTAGQYISLTGLLYTADTAIASGATFYTSGGNKNLTECVGGGFNDLIRSETIPLSIDDTAHISNISNCQCIRIGRVCILSLACQISTTGTGWGNLINVGIVPKMQVNFAAFTSEGYRFSFAISDAGGNGVIAKAENKSIQGGYYVGSVVFPV